jgi:hypothetical protein
LATGAAKQYFFRGIRKVFCRLRRRKKFFWIAILTDFASQNQSKWRSKKPFLWRLAPPKTGQGLLHSPKIFNAKLKNTFFSNQRNLFWL